MKLLADFYSGQFAAMEESVETWKSGHEEAMEVRDVEDVIQLAIKLHDHLAAFVNDCWDAAFRARHHKTQNLGFAILHSLDCAVNAWKSINAVVISYAGKGYVIDNGNLVEQAMRRMREIREDFKNRWPLIEEEQKSRSREEIAGGECRRAEDILRELQITTDSSRP